MYGLQMQRLELYPNAAIVLLNAHRTLAVVSEEGLDGDVDLKDHFG